MNIIHLFLFHAKSQRNCISSGCKMRLKYNDIEENIVRRKTYIKLHAREVDVQKKILIEQHAIFRRIQDQHECF